MRFIICLAVVFSAVRVDANENWLQFRGGTAGKLSEVRHPIAWSEDENIAWTSPLKGAGWSSPVVVGNLVFLTAAESEKGPSAPKGMLAGVASMATYRAAKPSKHRFTVACLRLDDGEVVWARLATEATPPAIHPSNTYATESPASDGERVYAYFGATGSLVAFSFRGEELWRQELGRFRSGNSFGTGSSLAVSDGLVFVQCDNEENSFVAAFEAASGVERWRQSRPSKTSWSTPTIWNNGARLELICCGSDVVTAYEPRSGESLWRLSGMKSAFSGSPGVGRNRLFVGNSGPMSAGPLVAIPAGLQGEVPLDEDFLAKQIAWSRTKSGPGMASPVVAAGMLYVPGSGGILNAYDVESGERVYRTRVSKMSTVAASLWADDEHVFLLDEKGATFVVATGPEFQLIGKNSIPGLFWSTPAVAGKSLLIRGADKLYCVRDE